MYTVYINIHYTHIMFINNKHIMCITHMYIHVNIHHRNEVSHQQDMILNPRWYHFRYTQTCNEYTLYFQYVHILYTYIVYIIVYIYCIHCIYCIHILYTYIQEMTHGYTWIIYWWWLYPIASHDIPETGLSGIFTPVCLFKLRMSESLAKSATIVVHFHTFFE